MLSAIVETSLRRRRFVAAFALALVAYGAWTASRAKLDVLPDFAPPQFTIQTEAPGFAPEQVEQLVTRPIEASVAGVSGLAALRSESIQGLSVVTAIFDDDADVYRSRQVLAENLADAAARLGLGVGPPRLSPLTSATMDVLKIGLTSEARSPMELRTLADWTIRPRLLMVPGVARVNVFGGEVRQIEIRIDPAALLARGLALGDVVAAARAAIGVRGAGFVDTPNQRIVVDAAAGELTTQEIAGVVVASRDGVPLRLADLASVAEQPAPRFGDALIQGRGGVLLTLSASYGANTMDVTRSLEAALAELGPLLQRQGVTLHPRLHRPASFVESALGNLRNALLLGGGLVVVVLLAFLQNRRAAWVSLTAIPLSLFAALIVLDRLGVTLNTMSLGGLAIAIGEVVDDAIIDVENIVRRLRENEAAGRPRSAPSVVLGASLEVRQTVVYATFAVALVFAPLLLLKGLTGRFFAPLALSYLLAVFASLAVALTVTPALSLIAFGGRPLAPQDPPLQARAKAAYRRLLERVLVRPGPLAAALGGLCLVALVTAWFLGGEFLPSFREGHLVLQVATAPGASLDESLRIGRQISKGLLALPQIESVEQQVGRAEQGEDTWGPNRSEFHVELRPGGDEDRITDEVRALLAATPGIQSEVLTFLGDRISETLSGEVAEVAINVFGDDLDLLESKGEEMARALRETPGAVDVRAGESASAPHLFLRFRSEALQRYGIRRSDVLDSLEAALGGVVVAQVQRSGWPLDVVVRLEGGERGDPAQVSGLLVRSPGGAATPLAEVADLELRDARDRILHEGGQRRQTVTCNVSGRDVTSFVAEAKRRIEADVELPGDLYYTVGGTAAARAQAQRDLSFRAGLGALGVVLLLSVVARRGRNLLLLLLNLPLALLGGVLSVAVAAGLRGEAPALSLGSLVGFVTLFGVTTRNAIMMISHFQKLVEEGARWSEETALRGAADRLVPIVMTALVTALGLLPVALASNRPGGEIDGPMATVILGGLVTSTVLNLLVLPLLCIRFGRFGAPADGTVLPSGASS